MLGELLIIGVLLALVAGPVVVLMKRRQPPGQDLKLPRRISADTPISEQRAIGRREAATSFTWSTSPVVIVAIVLVIAALVALVLL